MIAVVDSPKKTCTCKKCESVLQYAFSDIKQYKINFDYLGDFDLVRGIKCPVCDNIVKVS